MRKKTKKSRRKKNRNITRLWLRRLAMAVGVFLVLLVTAHILVDVFEEDIFASLVEKYESKSGGLYTVSYDSVDLNFLKRGLRVANLTVRLDREKAGTQEGKVFIETPRPITYMALQGISISSLLFSPGLDAGKLIVSGGELRLVVPPRKGEKGKPGEETHAGSSTGTPKRLGPFHLKRLILDDIALQVLEPGKSVPMANVAAMSADFSGLKISRQKDGPGPVVFRFRKGSARLEQPSFTERKGFYTLKAETVTFSRDQSSLAADGLELIPAYDDLQFSRVKGYRSSRIAVHLERARLAGIRFEDLFAGRGFLCETLTLEGPELDIFRDRHIPRRAGGKKKKFPQELLRDMGLKVKISNIEIKGGSLDYRVRPERLRREVKISLSPIQAHLENFGNLPAQTEEDGVLDVSVSAGFMDRTRLQLDLSMPLQDTNNNFVLSGSMGGLNLRDLNPVLSPIARLRIDRGVLMGVKFKMTGDAASTRGEMQASYKDLKVSLFKKERPVKKRKFVSFIANTFIHEDNPRKGKSLRVGRIFFERSEDMPFLSYLWKSLGTGIQSSVGLKRKKK